MPSSDNGDIDPYHHLNCFQQQVHHQHASQPSNGSSTRRRSSYGNSHYSQQLTAAPIMFKDSCSLIGSQDNLGCSSPSRYDCYVATASRPQSRYDENLSCCIPPPSPAPQNDRFVIGPQHRLMVQQQSQQQQGQRSMSPSSRYRSSMSDRHAFRDMSPNPGHFLAGASTDNFTTYLSSAVHTPVKRYIPTPPLTCTNDSASTYSDGPTLSNPGYHLSLPPAQNALTQIGSSQTLKPSKSRLSQQQQQQAPQYRMNMKCCSEAVAKAAAMNTSTLPLPSSQADHYATTPRMRPATLNPNKSNNSVGGSTVVTTCCAQSQTGNQVQCDYVARAPNSSEYRVITPMNLMNQSDQSCLNCRRTAGVHQTTQTTGPISPVPQQPPLSMQTMSAVESHQSPLSPQPSTHSMASLQSVGQINADYSSNVIQHEKVISEEEPCNVQIQQPSQMNKLEQQQQQHSQQQVQSSHQQLQQEPSITASNRSFMFQYQHNDSSSNLLNPNLNIQQQQQQQQQSQQQQRNTLQQRQQTVSRYSRKQKVKEYVKREIAKFFGVDVGSEEEERIKWFERQKRLAIRCFGQLRDDMDISNSPHHQGRNEQIGYRPDILPAHNAEETERTHYKIERKASVATMMWKGVSYLTSRRHPRKQKQWSRSFAPAHVKSHDDSDLCDGLSPIQSDETFFDGGGQNVSDGNNRSLYSATTSVRNNGWQTKSSQHDHELHPGLRFGNRISSQLLDGIMDNSRRPMINEIKLQRPNDLDDRHDYRPFFTYWINTVHILVLAITMISYGIVAFGIGLEQKSGQVMVTNLNLQQVTHHEQQNVWVGLRSMDLIHLGAKFGGCMRRDAKILDVIAKTKRKERETACCIRNDDSGCVQTSQAECSVGGLWPTQKTISTWKKWSPGDSGPGGRISGSVCGLDPKYCDAPTSIAPYEWPDDITKWPICRKTNSFSHRSRLKDHTAEHMVCEIIGHPCCTGVYGECRITTKEYCDFINGYFHEEASLCSQVSCMGNVCGMFPFFSNDVPDQFYRLFTSLYLHAGIFHLIITIAFQHIFLSDLERLLGPLRTAIIYISSGIAGNLTSAIFVPYRPEVGSLSSLAGIIASLIVLLTFCHWKQLKKPYLALIKLLLIAACLFGMSTLPWQQNFAGLIGGIIFGGGLTIALVPFVYITKYNRKSKINLIWTCILLQLLVYAAMFVIFYVFPTLFSPLGFSGSHPNDHFTINGLPGHYDDHTSTQNHQNVFNGVINNFNTGGGIVSSLRLSSSSSSSQEFHEHVNIGHKNYQ